MEVSRQWRQTDSQALAALSWLPNTMRAQDTFAATQRISAAWVAVLLLLCTSCAPVQPWTTTRPSGFDTLWKTVVPSISATNMPLAHLVTELNAIAQRESGGQHSVRLLSSHRSGGRRMSLTLNDAPFGVVISTIAFSTSQFVTFSGNKVALADWYPGEGSCPIVVEGVCTDQDGIPVFDFDLVSEHRTSFFSEAPSAIRVNVITNRDGVFRIAIMTACSSAHVKTDVGVLDVDYLVEQRCGISLYAEGYEPQSTVIDLKRHSKHYFLSITLHRRQN